MKRAAGSPRRLGVFGGTFDPPHVGHLAIAEWARERLGLDRVLFVPSGVPPHKRARRVSPAAGRLAMTRLAVRGNPHFEVSALEARRRGPSYTVDTLRALRARHPSARLYLLMGADSLAEFGTWHEPEQILELATLAVAARPVGRAAAHHAGPRRASIPRRVAALDNPPLAVSSSGIRARVRAGRTIRYLVPDAVVGYIERHRLYAGPR